MACFCFRPCLPRCRAICNRCSHSALLIADPHGCLRLSHFPFTCEAPAARKRSQADSVRDGRAATSGRRQTHSPKLYHQRHGHGGVQASKPVGLDAGDIRPVPKGEQRLMDGSHPGDGKSCELGKRWDGLVHTVCLHSGEDVEYIRGDDSIDQCGRCPRDIYRGVIPACCNPTADKS
jgi:hypothetical protein